MAQSEALKVAYSSDPTKKIIRSFIMHGEGFESVRLVHAYEEIALSGQLHEPCQISFKLPAKDATGNQKLNFAVGLVDARAQKAVSAAIAADKTIYLTYSEYLETDLSAPAAKPFTMVVVGGELSSLQVQIESQYFDMLNFMWPRERYTLEKAPGTKYI